MNKVILMGRLTRDPEVRYGAASQTAVARFSIAVDRPRAKEGEQTADFINIVCFGKTAELVEKYLGKGRLVGITGRIQTGSYEKDGKKVYTTEVHADRVEFLDRGDRTSETSQSFSTPAPAAPAMPSVPEGFSQLTDDDIPF